MSDPSPPEPGTEPAEGSTLRGRVNELRGRAAAIEELAKQRLEVGQRHRGWVRAVLLAYEADRNRAGGLLAGGLAYRIFLWSLPAILFVVSAINVVARITGQDTVTTLRNAGLTSAMVEAIASAVQQTGSGWWWLLVVGSVLTVWAGRSAARAFWIVSQVAWQRRAPRPGSVRASFVFSGFVLFLLFVPLVLSSVMQGEFLVGVVEWILVTFLYAVAAAFAISLLPRGRQTSWTAVLPGALMFALVVRGMTMGSALYFNHRLDTVNDLYGAFGLAIVILLWLYIVSRVFVGGMFLNATIAGVPAGHLEEEGMIPATPTDDASSEEGAPPG